MLPFAWTVLPELFATAGGLVVAASNLVEDVR